MKSRHAFIAGLSFILLINPYVQSQQLRYLFSILFLLFCAYSIYILRKSHPISIKPYQSLLLALYMILVGASVIRGWLGGLIALRTCVFFLSLYGLSFVVLLQLTRSGKQIYSEFMECAAVVVVLNLLLLVFGVTGRYVFLSVGTNTPNSLLRLVGITYDRTLFYFSSGYQSYGMLCGLVLIYSLWKAKDAKHKVYYFSLSILAAISILITDARGAAIFVLAIIFLWILLRERIVLLQVPLLLATTTLLFLIVNNAELFDFVAKLMSPISREGANFLSNRNVLWGIVLNHFRFFRPMDLIGYGMFGQANLGVSDDYAFLFAGWATDRPELFSTHNFLLQNFVDLGYFGVLTLLVIIITSAIQLQRLERVKEKVLWSISLIFIILSGTVDLTINIYNSFIFICSFMLFLTIDAHFNLASNQPVIESKPTHPSSSDETNRLVFSLQGWIRSSPSSKSSPSSSAPPPQIPTSSATP